MRHGPTVCVLIVPQPAGDSEGWSNMAGNMIKDYGLTTKTTGDSVSYEKMGGCDVQRLA